MSDGFFTEAEMLKYVGERCDEQRAGCPVCRAWSRFDFINHLHHEDEGTRLVFEAEDAAEDKTHG